ncbi:MAG: IS5 family transposase [Bacteroidales bacterium]
MLKKLPVQTQLEMYKTVLTSFINPEHELCLLAKKIDWAGLEKEFAPLYGKVGHPSIPIRTIVRLILLKQMYNLGDETVVERYIENPYWQHFCGEIYFQYKLPFDPSDFVHFRHRIGPKGMEKIFKASIDLFDKNLIRKEVKEVRVDTTVQEKNITFPTDRKLIEKVIEPCKRIAKKEDITLKRTYSRGIKKLKHQLRFARKPKKMRQHIKAQKKLHRIAFKTYQDVVKQLSPIPKSYMKEFDVLYRILTQQRDDSNKVYSVYEPEVLCISKGKEHKHYEFGNTSSFAYTRESEIIVGAMAFEGNAYDGHTLKPQLEQIKYLTGGKIKKTIVDRGYKIKKGILGIEIVLPKMLKRESYYLKKKREERCRSRAGIEGLISHLKHDHRMIRNYLSGTAGDQTNTLLAAAAYNMMKWMRLKRQEILDLIFYWIYRRLILVPVNIQR